MLPRLPRTWRYYLYVHQGTVAWSEHSVRLSAHRITYVKVMNFSIFGDATGTWPYLKYVGTILESSPVLVGVQSKC